MKKSLIAAIFLTLLNCNGSFAQNAVAVELSKNSIGTDLNVYFSEYSIGADETWHIAGECNSVGNTNSLSVYVSEYSIGSDLDIYLTKNSIGADRIICITNANDAPEAFWKIYNKL